MEPVEAAEVIMHADATYSGNDDRVAENTQKG